MPPPPAPIRLGPRHMARAQRERWMSRALLVGVGLALASVVGLVGYGVADELVFAPRRPVATVNGDPISRQELSARAALARADLVQQSRSLQSMLSFFAGSPEVSQSVQDQIARINAQINDPNLLSRQVLQDLIHARLIRAEANRRGITVQPEEIDRAIADAFGFFPDGTPTPEPAPTLNPTLAAEATAQATPTASATPEASPTASPPSPTPTSGPSATPAPTPTVYTRQAFDAEYAQYLEDLKANLGVETQYFRDQFEERLYRERLRASIGAEVPLTEEQARASHILVPDQAVALALLSRLRQGESWDDLAAAHSQDPGNKDRGGDLGWFGRGVMTEPFEQTAFSAPLGEVVGPVQTSFGWHLIRVDDRRERPLDSAAYEQAVDRAFTAWLASAIQEAELTFDPNVVAPTPTPGLELQATPTGGP